ncbi:MAG: hypothetical protein ACJ716_16170 [Marmoricola sp.]
MISSMLVIALASACGHHTAQHQAATVRVPNLQEVGSRAHEYTSLDQVAAIANALVLATPTGRQSSTPLPVRPGDGPDPAPTTYVEMHIEKVLSGSVKSSTVQVVSLGQDENTGGPALLTGGPFLMYLAPAMYGAHDPAGGYVVAGGPAGAYVSDGLGTYLKLDSLDPGLPSTISSAADLPETNHSESELLAIGPQ